MSLSRDKQTPRENISKENIKLFNRKYQKYLMLLSLQTENVECLELCFQRFPPGSQSPGQRTIIIIIIISICANNRPVNYYYYYYYHYCFYLCQQLASQLILLSLLFLSVPTTGQSTFTIIIITFISSCSHLARHLTVLIFSLNGKYFSLPDCNSHLQAWSSPPTNNLSLITVIM